MVAMVTAPEGAEAARDSAAAREAEGRRAPLRRIEVLRLFDEAAQLGRGGRSSVRDRWNRDEIEFEQGSGE